MKCHSIHQIIVLVLFVFSHCLTAQNKGEVVVPLSNPNSIGRLDVNIKKGTVRVSGSNRKDILIKYSKIEKADKNAEYEARVEASNKTEKVPAGMKKIGGSKIALEITEKDNTIWVKNSKLSNNLDIEVEIPYSFNVVVKTYLGDGISISNVTGEMNLESDLGGYVKAENITGIINASTYSGDVIVTFKDIPKPTDMIFRNYSGNIDISVPASYKSNLKLKTSEGEIFSLLDLEVYNNEVELQKETSEGSFRAYTDSWTYAKLNGGGPEIKVSSELGNIYFRPKQ